MRVPAVKLLRAELAKEASDNPDEGWQYSSESTYSSSINDNPKVVGDSKHGDQPPRKQLMRLGLAGLAITAISIAGFMWFSSNSKQVIEVTNVDVVDEPTTMQKLPSHSTNALPTALVARKRQALIQRRGETFIFATSKMPLGNGLFLTLSLVAIDPNDEFAHRLKGMAGVVLLENLTSTIDHQLDEQTTVTLFRGGRQIIFIDPEARNLNEHARTADYSSFSARELLNILRLKGGIAIEVNGRSYQLEQRWTEQVDDLADQIGIRLSRNGF